MSASKISTLSLHQIFPIKLIFRKPVKMFIFIEAADL